MPHGGETRNRGLPLLEEQPQVTLRTWVQLAKTFHLIERRVIAALAERDMTLPQFDVLATLRFSQGVAQQELARRLLVTKGNICGLMDRLERYGWVERLADPKDGRANRLYLTSAGKRKIDAVLPHHDAVVLKALGTLSAPDLKKLLAFLEQLERANHDAV